MTSIKSTSLLRYKGVQLSEINEDNQNLVNKQYVDKCFYPFGSARTVLATQTASADPETVFVIVPSITDSYWSIIGPNTSGQIVIQPENIAYEEYAMFTFELMIVKNTNHTISFKTAVDWIGNTPTIEDNKIYFFAFRAIYISGSWRIIGNMQGELNI